MMGMHVAIRPAAAAARSASLPREHSHPVLARLDGGICALRSWSVAEAAAASSGLDDGRCSGVALVEDVLVVLGELLALPQAAAEIHRAAVACERVLDGFLVLADAYGTFESALLALKQSAADLRVGARRGDGALVAAALHAHRRTEKQLCRLAAAMRHAQRRRTPSAAAASRTTNDTDGEVIDIVAEAAAVTAAASEVIFSRCATSSRDVPALVQTVPSNKWWLARLPVARAGKKAAPETAAPPPLKRLEELEECIGVMESGSEKVFRKLLQIRVSLLNIHNPL
ncbi:hypothetical protein GUJ93_ZPchr0012g20788 [Zizania palustris]|uniref:Uncharacterized protein n=1 Tax=Zizania palustris TaxID=103762 RepID=A0A8J5WJ69_ZIZPA|nr:hypothetical protein GUJ93_ZPchr0012g20788 [Zizania palustris]